MKRNIAIILAFAMSCTALIGCSQASSENEPESSTAVASGTSEDEQNSDNYVSDESDQSVYTYSEEKLEVGVVGVYDFGNIKLHAYKTNDLMDDECYLLESESEVIAIESPCFYDNINEYNDYINSLGKPLNNALLAYHPNGGENFESINSEINYIATPGADAARQEGGSVVLASVEFAENFGENYDGTIPAATEIKAPGSINIGGIDFVLSEGDDGYDIEIPEINCIFTHMVGSDVHNIVPSVEAIDALADKMQSYIDKNYTLILTSHYVPESIDAAKIKLDYLDRLKELYQNCTNSEEFIAAVNSEFPDYSGAGFLESTASGLYQ